MQKSPLYLLIKKNTQPKTLNIKINKKQKVMANEIKKNQGPTCACGKGDLFEEWLKLQENEKEEISDSITSNQTVDYNSSADDAQKPEQTTK